ncbi:MAG: ABC transporter permease, partial [Mesotoga sp.]|nr:ABC transporter permease [Mesotoga sp.]
MSSQALARELRASWAFIERNFNFTNRYWKWELVFFVSIMANSVTMGFIGEGILAFSGLKLDTC